MFEDYKKEVRECYISKKANSQLSTALENPERLKLKRECLRIYMIKNSTEDTEVIKEFFDPLGKYEDHLKSIDRVELDKFRPLITFLNRGSAIRDEAPVKLLAWLIDFSSYQDWKVRKYGLGTNHYLRDTIIGNLAPDYDLDLKVIANEKKIETPIVPNQDTEIFQQTSIDLSIGEEQKPGGQEDGTIDDVEAEGKMLPGNDPLPSISKRPNHKIFMIAVVFLVLAVIGIALYQNPFLDSAIKNIPTQKCMYWNGAKYVPIECTQNANKTGIIPLDIRLLQTFRKISWADTLTKKAIGSIWYAKNGREYEFYTDSGKHPMDNRTRLKPLTPYILSNHVSIYRFMLKALLLAIAIISLIFLVLFLMTKSNKKVLKGI